MWYIRIMSSLQAYAVRGNRYWRIVESYRDPKGRPRIRVLRHLGTAQKLLELLSQAPGRPLYAEERERRRGLKERRSASISSWRRSTGLLRPPANANSPPGTVAPFSAGSSRCVLLHCAVSASGII